VANSTGVFVNTAFIGTLTANNSTNFGGLSLATVQGQITGNAATAYTNAVSYVDGKSFVNTSQLSSNLSNYQTTAGLAANVATLTSNNSTRFDGQTLTTIQSQISGNAGTAYTNAVNYVTTQSFVNTAQLSANLSLYQTTAGLAANVLTLTANNTTNFNSQPASFYTNATNITTGTLNNARLPTTIDVTTVNAATISAGNTNAINITTRTSSGSNGATLSALGTAGLWLIANTLSTTATGETAPRDIFFKPDGLKMYFTGSTTDNVFEYDLATAWEVGTATYTANVASGDASPEGLFFRSNGTKMYVLGSSGDTVREFNLSAAWSVNTATFVGSFSVASQDVTPTGISFSDTGDKMFIMGTANDRLFEYNLSTPWVVNTAVYNSQSFSVAAQDLTPHSLNFNSTGTRFFFTGITTDALYWYDLATPWSVNTAVYVDSRSLGNDSRQALGVWVESSQNKAWIADDTNDRIIQYSTNNAGLNVNSAVNHFTGFTDFSRDVGITGKLHVADDITTEASLVVGSSFNSGGAVTLATTTSVINMGGSQTTGNTIIGGTTQTGLIQVGRSTANQTVSIANGATTSGNTKIVNIGTDGLSGSNTTINIGSSLGTGSVTINQPTTVSTNTFTVGTAAYVVANGNIGIGNTAPDARLTVTGTANVSGNVVIGGMLTVGANLNVSNTAELVFAANAGIVANGSLGTAGQALFSNGTSIYWDTVAAGVNVAAQFSWTNTHSFAANLTIGSTSELIIANGAGIIANGSLGTAAQVLSSNGVGVYWADGGISASGTATLTNKRIDPRVFSTASATSVTPDISTTDMYVYTALSTAITVNASTGGSPVDGNKMTFRFKDNGTARGITWTTSGSNSFRAVGVTLPTTTVINKVTYVGCIYNAAESFWDVVAVLTQA
jgi:hypothetical protein